MALVVQGDGKHAAKFLNALCAQFLIEMNDNFGIAVGIETVPTLFEVIPQFRKVVDLAVENNPDGLVFVMNGLMTTGKIDDAETAHAEAGASTRSNAFVVGATVDNRGAHPTDCGGIYDFIWAANQACYPAHRSTASTGSSTLRFGLCGMVPRTDTGTLATWRSSSPHASNQRNTSSYVCLD